MKFYRMSFCVLTSALILLGCSKFTKDKAPDSSSKFSGKSEALETGCELSTKRLAKILEEDVKGDLICLQKNFQVLRRTVMSPTPGVLSKGELQAVIRNILGNSVDQGLMDGTLEILFQVNQMVFNASPDKIRIDDIDKLINFAVSLNARYVRDIRPALDAKPRSYDEHLQNRQRVVDGATDLVAELRALFVANRSTTFKINISDVLDRFTQNETIAKVRDLLFIKRIFLGGYNPRELTNDEVLRLLDIAPALAGAAYDAGKAFDIGKDDNEKDVCYRLLLSAVEEIQTLVYHFRPTERVVLMEDIANYTKHLSEKMYDFSKNVGEMQEAKAGLIGGSGYSITMQDLYDGERGLFFRAKRILGAQAFYYSMYRQFASELNKGERLTESSDLIRRMREYDVADSVKDFRDEFVNVVLKYRFFNTQDVTLSNGKDVKLPFFSQVRKRSAKGVADTALVEYLVKWAVKAYGVHESKIDPARPDYKDPMGFGYVLDKNLIDKAVVKFEKFLTKMNMWNPDHFSMSKSVQMLSDMFQYQSNGDDVVNVNEMVEYLMLGADSKLVSDAMFEKGLDVCKAENQVVAEEVVDPKGHREIVEYPARICLNKHFWELLLTDEVKKSLPNLAKYINGLSIEQQQNYLLKTESFAIDPSASNSRKMTRRDILLSLGSFFNIESTLLRFDANEEWDILDFNELVGQPLEGMQSTFQVYVGAIVALTPSLKKMGEGFQKSALLYLVKYNRTPKTAEFLKFHYFVKKKNIEANRMSVAAILNYIYMANNPQLGHPTTLVDESDEALPTGLVQ